MKKLLLLVIAIAMFTSCSNEAVNQDLIPSKTELTIEEQNKLELIKVNNQICDFNNHLTVAQRPQTRGWFKKFWKALVTVVLSDANGAWSHAVGGTVGMIGGAVLSSAIAVIPYIDTNPSSAAPNAIGDEPQVDTWSPMNPPTISLNYLVPTNAAGEVTNRNDSIGYYHNQALLDICSEDASAYSSMDALIKRTAQEISALYNVDYDEVVVCLQSNPQHLQYVIAIKENMDNYTSVDDVTAAWASYYPSQQEIINIIGSFVDGLSNYTVGENHGDYLAAILAIIENSDLDEETKQELRSSIIVANASYQLWNTGSEEE